MLDLTVGCIVEGHGDGFGLPVLARRLAKEVRDDLNLKLEIRRVRKSQVLRADGLERALEALSRQIGRAAPILGEPLLGDPPSGEVFPAAGSGTSEARVVFPEVGKRDCEYRQELACGTDGIGEMSKSR